MVDWGTGRYETTAERLLPVAEAVVGSAGIGAGQEVLDVGCGTGNAALIAAQAGAHVTGLDPAQRLLDVGRERAEAEGLALRWIEGGAEELPFEDGSFDRVLSIFGVIFAQDPERAITEAVRVLRPGGEALLTAWIPEGPISEMVGALRRGLAEATGAEPPAPFAWHETAAVAAVADRAGAEVTSKEAETHFEDDSPEAYFAGEESNHPMSLAMRPALEGAGIYERVREEAIAVLREANELEGGFRVTSRYRIHRLSLSG